VTKQRDPESGMFSLLFQVDFPEIAADVTPLFRVMSAFEQRYEPAERAWQYCVIAAQPYESICFKVQGNLFGRVVGFCFVVSIFLVDRFCNLFCSCFLARFRAGRLTRAKRGTGRTGTQTHGSFSYTCSFARVSAACRLSTEVW
jgi:hypothetical protein